MGSTFPFKNRSTLLISHVERVWTTFLMMLNDADSTFRLFLGADNNI